MSEIIKITKEQLTKEIEDSFMDGYKLALSNSHDALIEMFNKVDRNGLKLSIDQVTSLIDMAKEESIKINDVK